MEGCCSDFLSPYRSNLTQPPPAHKISTFLREILRIDIAEAGQGFSRPFLASAPDFLSGEQGNRSERPIKVEMIQEYLSSKKPQAIKIGVFFAFYGPQNGMKDRFRKRENEGDGPLTLPLK
jgi:hypothetical protein